MIYLNDGLPFKPSGRQILEASKFHRCSTVGWRTVGFNFALEESYRCWAQGWLPPKIILVADSTFDEDFYIVNWELTLDANALSEDWLSQNRPDDFQIPLF